jgi:hypothetical protein
MKLIFPHGIFWILANDEEVMIGTLNEVESCLFVFSDDDLARTFAQKHRIEKKVVAMQGKTALAFLERMQSLRVTHVSVDAATFASGEGTATIEKVIADVRQQLSE